MPNIFEYMQILLKLLLSARIYKQFFNRPNLIYIVGPIKKTGFKDLAFVILSAGAIFNIPQTIIFVKSIDKVIEIVKNL